VNVLDENVAAGLMLQSLPSDESGVDENTQAEGWNHASILADTIKDEELIELEAQQLLHRLYHEEDLRLYDAKDIRFECSCYMRFVLSVKQRQDQSLKNKIKLRLIVIFVIPNMF